MEHTKSQPRMATFIVTIAVIHDRDIYCLAHRYISFEVATPIVWRHDLHHPFLQKVCVQARSPLPWGGDGGRF